MSVLDPAAVDAALRQVIAHADYDLHKSLEGDESGEDTYEEYVRRFITEYGKAADASAPGSTSSAVCGEQPWDSDVPVHGCVREPGHEPFHRDAEGRQFVSRASIAEASADIAREDGSEKAEGR